MAQSEKAPPKNNISKNIVRIGVGIVFVILIVLALMDRSAKNSATGTTTAWLDSLQSATGNDQELKYSELSQHVTGSPEVTGEPSQGSVVYTWKGTFRSYATKVTLDDADPPVVSRIEGPSS